MRADVYRVSSRDAENDCATRTEQCDVALQIRFISRVSVRVLSSVTMLSFS